MRTVNFRLAIRLTALAILLPCLARGTENSAPLNPLAAVDAASLHAFIDLPLFSPSRSTPAEAVVEAPPPAPPPPPPAEEPPPDVQLVGIIRSPAGTIARVVEPATGTTLTLHEGDLVGSWTVKSVDTISLQLALGDRVTELKLFVAKPEGASANPDPDGLASPDQQPPAPQPPRAGNRPNVTAQEAQGAYENSQPPVR